MLLVLAFTGTSQAQGKVEETVEVTKILDQARNVYSTTIRSDPPYHQNGVLTWEYVFLEQIAANQAIAGDLKGALQTANLFRDISQDGVDYILRGVATAQAHTGDVQGALQTVEIIQDSFHQELTLTEISLWQAKRGDRDGALQTAALIKNESGNVSWLIDGLPRVMYEEKYQSASSASPESLRSFLEVGSKIAATIKDKHKKAAALRLLAITQAREGDVHGAIRTTAAIQPEDEKHKALLVIAQARAAAQTKAGDVEGAWQIADTFPDEKTKDQILKVIAVQQAKAGSLKRALQTVAAIQGQEQKDPALLLMARVQAKGSDIEGALDTIALIQNQQVKDRALVSIARVQAKGNDIEGALHTIALIQNQGQKDNALMNVAIRQAKAGDVMGARQIIGSIQDKAASDEVMKSILKAQARAGALNEALQTIPTLQEYAKDPGLRAISEGLVTKGDWMQAHQVVTAIQDEDTKANAFGYLAKAQAKSGNEREVLRWVEQQTSPLDKSNALLGAGEGLLERKDGGKSLDKIVSLAYLW